MPAPPQPVEPTMDPAMAMNMPMTNQVFPAAGPSEAQGGVGQAVMGKGKGEVDPEIVAGAPVGAQAMYAGQQ